MSQLSESSLKNLTNSLVEMVDLNGPAANSEFAPSHIQFHRFEKCDAQAELASESPSVWFVCSSGVPGRGDSYLSNLIFKSFRKGHFKAAAQVSFSTIISDIAQEKNLSKYRTLPDLLSSFPNNKVEGQELNKLGAFQKNFISWVFI